MFTNRNRQQKAAVVAPSVATQPTTIKPGILKATKTAQRAPLARPEPDYEVVDFPSQQYVNAKVQPPPAPPRPDNEAGACGLCGGGGAQFQCGECDRQAFCASCDDMYHRHPKRRHHKRQAMSPKQRVQMEVLPPLPPKATPPVPPPRRHKVIGDRMSASPRPLMMDQQRRSTLGNINMNPIQATALQHVATAQRQFPSPNSTLEQQATANPMTRTSRFGLSPPGSAGHLGSMPFLNSMQQQPTILNQPHQQMALAGPNIMPQQMQTIGPNMRPWAGPNVPSWPPNNVPLTNMWEAQVNSSPVPPVGWNNGMRRGASVLDVGAGACGHCAGSHWRYGSCTNLDVPWAPAPCCNTHTLPPHYTAQPYRKDSRTTSRMTSRSRCASPAASIRSRMSRRGKHRTPSPPLPHSSDADSESDSDSGRRPQDRRIVDQVSERGGNHDQHTRKDRFEERISNRRRRNSEQSNSNINPGVNRRTSDTRDEPSLHRPSPEPNEEVQEDKGLGPPPSPPNVSWQCEHCTFANEPGVRVCVVCCRTPTVKPRVLNTPTSFDQPATDKTFNTPATKGEYSAQDKKQTRLNTGCGPSPPREERVINTEESLQNGLKKMSLVSQSEPTTTKHSIAVGDSPPRESPHKISKEQKKEKHSVSIGPSPPREAISVKGEAYVRPSVPPNNSISKTSTGTSPPRFNDNGTRASVECRRPVSTGTSPPPQTISTQTYEDPGTWERPASRSRSQQRRYNEDNRRERSQSRHSLSSETRDSERSSKTTGRWEWRDVSPPGGGECREDRHPLARRASHLDIRREPQPPPRNRYSPETTNRAEQRSLGRASSMEALARLSRGQNQLPSSRGRRHDEEARKGVELARLLSEAERAGFSAGEVQAALAQSPAAPLGWLRARWRPLCAAVQAAALRLAPDVHVSEADARAALARHRGAMWPALTDCVERYRRRQAGVSEEAALRGRVWGSPAGADDDDAAPPPSRGDPSPHRSRAEDSSDDFEVLSSELRRDHWMYSPLDDRCRERIDNDIDTVLWNESTDSESMAQKIDELLIQESEMSFDNLSSTSSSQMRDLYNAESISINNMESLDLGQPENDFINAYNALTRLSPLPKKNKPKEYNNTSNSDNPKHISQLFMTQTIKSHNITNTTRSGNNIAVNKLTIPLVNNPFISSNGGSLETNLDANQSLPSEDNHISNKAHDEVTSENLTDIVDNTQRLIQQMKEEINLDINNINDNSEKLSESGSNSDESDSLDHEGSSYSGSGEDTDISSDVEKSKIKSNDQSVTNINQTEPKEPVRSSSEENELFEEAIDHIDQNHNFETSNYEILDTIARSLRGDHTVSIENKTKQNNGQINKAPQVTVHKLTTVNSFEEIYEELSTTNKLPNSQTSSPILINHEEPTTGNTILTNMHISVDKTPDIKNYIKQDMVIKRFSPALPYQLHIMDVKTPTFNAVIEPQNITTITNEPHDVIPITIALEHNGHTTETEIPINNIDHTYDKEEANLQSAVSDLDVTPDVNLIDNNINNNIQSNLARKLSDEESETNELKLPKKSNIPKLIKSLQAVKSKSDKNVKVISSKVPVRRNSFKQNNGIGSPKAIFGNVQSGQVKQLQNRLFKPVKMIFSQNYKVSLNQPTASTSSAVDLKITDSQPERPTNQLLPKQEDNEAPLSPDTPRKEQRKQYFRETCRTEDEWSGTDSDDSQDPPRRVETPEPVRRSPPPPVTLRRVSGKLIDLANVRIIEGSPERQARMLIADGAIETWEQAVLAVELVKRGTETATALLAALECIDLDTALAYLQQECELCASYLPEHEMVSMLRCAHRCCRECARHYYTVQVSERSISDCVCPFCKQPELEALTEDDWLHYFAHFDIQLRTLVDAQVHELFQRKLRDRTLARDPNFKWCVECSSGFFVHPKQKKLRCPECRSVSCASCRKPWSSNHEGLSCEQYAAWLEDNDPERSIAAVNQHLRDNGLDCPRCHFKYSLSRGGCMHFTCTQCKFEFCYGCGKPFMMGARCGLSEYCAKLGLHAHHPRNCLFYLRDKEPRDLQTLLQMNNVSYEMEAAEGSSVRCPVQLQRETPTGLVDGPCNSEVPPNHAGLCKSHYVEQLARLVMQRALDPLPVMDLSELVAELRRRALPLPERGPWDTDPIYAGMCAQMVKEKIPLD